MQTCGEARPVVCDGKEFRLAGVGLSPGGQDTGFSFSIPGSCHKLALWTLAELCHHVLPSVVLKDLIPISGGRPETLMPRTAQSLIKSLNQNDLGKLT